MIESTNPSFHNSTEHKDLQNTSVARGNIFNKWERRDAIHRVSPKQKTKKEAIRTDAIHRVSPKK